MVKKPIISGSEKDAYLIIGCGKAKIWDSKPFLRSIRSKEAYTSAMFRLCRMYAEAFYPGRWLILSAKYGLILPDKRIEKYDVSFGSVKQANKHRLITIDTLARQCKNHLHNAKKVVCLAGKQYALMLKSVLQNETEMECPLSNMGLFARMAWLRTQIRSVIVPRDNTIV